MSPDSGHFWNFGLLGYPLGHSLSPVLHRAALQAAGLTGDYQLFPIPPGKEGEQQIGQKIELLRSGELDGLNVTIPHKQVVIPFADRLTATAEAVGAVNTLVRGTDGLLLGDNTDVPGFWRDVRKILTNDTGRALVLGAGGSARAAVYSLVLAGWDVIILARQTVQAEALAGQFQGDANARGMIATGMLDTQSLADCSLNCGLVVNTTPLGMHPNPDTCPWPEDLELPGSAAVYDLVYNPLETRLVRRARAQGLRALNGAGMLSAQAALAFSKWTGFEPPFEIMENAFPGHAPG